MLMYIPYGIKNSRVAAHHACNIKVIQNPMEETSTTFPKKIKLHKEVGTTSSIPSFNKFKHLSYS